jgi:hypothetical protein
MFGRVAALAGIIGMAAVGSWLSHRRQHRGQQWIMPPASGPVDIDDDTAADIIKRVRPELERVRQEQFGS